MDNSISIDDLEISLRTYTMLAQAGVKTIGQVTEYLQAKHLYPATRIRGFGPKQVKEVVAAIQEVAAAEVTADNLGYKGISRVEFMALATSTPFTDVSFPGCNVVRFDGPEQILEIESVVELGTPSMIFRVQKHGA